MGGIVCAGNGSLWLQDVDADGTKDSDVTLLGKVLGLRLVRGLY